MKIYVLRFGSSTVVTKIDIADLIEEKTGERPLKHNICFDNGNILVHIGEEPEDCIKQARLKELEKEA